MRTAQHPMLRDEFEGGIMVEFETLRRELLGNPEFADEYQGLLSADDKSDAGERFASAGLFLRMQREKQHLQIHEVAARAGLLVRHLEQIESGAAPPSYDSLIAAAEALGVAGQIRQWNKEHPFELPENNGRRPAPFGA